MGSKGTGNSSFSFDDDDDDDNIEFTFSDIPVLGHDSKGNGKDFSFESFKQPTTDTRRLKTINNDRQNSVSNVLNNSSEDYEESDIDTTHHASIDDINIRKPRLGKNNKTGKNISSILFVIVFIITIIAGGAYYLASMSKNSPDVDITVKPKDPAIPNRKVEIVKVETKSDGLKKDPQKIVQTNSDEADIDIDTETVKIKIKSLETYYSEIFALITDSSEDAKILTFEMFEKHPEKYKDYLDFQNRLIEKKYTNFALNVFQTIYQSQQNSAQAAFLYGKVLGNSPMAETCFKKAILIKKDYLDAYHSLGSYYYRNRKWDLAINIYSQATEHDPSNQFYRKRVVICNIRKNIDSGKQAILDYENHLRTTNYSESSIGTSLISLAQMFPETTVAKKYLGMIRTELDNPKVKEAYSIAFLMQKAIYLKTASRDFKKLPFNRVRNEYIMHLLCENRDREVMILTTPPQCFPDFWKAFLGWYSDSPSWGKSAKMLNEKYRNSEDQMIFLITSLWLNKISANDMRAKVNLVDVDSEPLLYMLLAEYYKKQGEQIKAKIMYSKAFKKRYGIYHNLIKHYSKKVTFYLKNRSK